MSVPTLISEDKRQYTRHNQLFKQLPHTFFTEFMERLLNYIIVRLYPKKVKRFQEKVLNKFLVTLKQQRV